MRGLRVRTAADETRALLQAIRSEGSSASVRSVAVSGVLAEQLARELGRGAEPGAVVVHDASRPPAADAAVHVIAGEPSEADVAFVDLADRAGVPVVLIQLWAQADWAPPFVLSPFVVECRTGEGFPIGEIATRIVESVDAPALGARVPALRDALVRRALRTAVARSAYLGAAGRSASRPLIALEQARLLARVEAATGLGLQAAPRAAAGSAVALFASGLALREAARAARRVLPTPIADVAIAAGATWALGTALDRLARARER